MKTATYRKLGNTRELSKAETNARKWFNKFICLRDLRKTESGIIKGNCISCGREYIVTLYSDSSIMNGKEWHAGHYFKEHQYASVRFDEHNVSGQCRHCNRILSGNEARYQENLIKKIGQQNFNALIIRKNKAKKYFIDGYEEIIKTYKQKAKEQAERIGIKL